MSINARNKGHNYERKIAKEWQKLGWATARTSRLASPELDAKKVDLVDTDPFFIQCKAVEQGINYHKLLLEMPYSKDNDNLIFHKRSKTEIVVMSKDAFYKLLKKIFHDEKR